MKGKELLKRLFLGRLVVFPAEVAAAMAPYGSPVRLDAEAPIRNFKVLFAVGQKG